ncbi:AraC family transcriptional regulator [Streptomyces sp. NPDC058955]|uniref:helix-turn-helix transcriptional regulator n=1 Tax=unclassified Streptomyces TaxID=2593676 RepID=UPI0036697182
MLLLDLASVEPRERVEAFRFAMTDQSVPNVITHEEPDRGVHATFETWRIGPLGLFSAHSSGVTLTRTERHVRHHRERPVVSVSLQTHGVHRAQVGDERRLLGPDDICVFHELTPRMYGWSGDGASQAIVIDAEELGVPEPVVRAASARLTGSPLHGLVLSHLRALWRDPAVLESDPGAPALAAATTALTRALLLSAAHDAGAAPVRDAMADTLVTRVDAYVRRNYADRELTAQRVALVHAVSVRSLYAALQKEGLSLEQMIITRRLEAARVMLADPCQRLLGVAAVAARCGFASPSHFTRRFTSAYGMSPSEWRRTAHD